MRFFQSVMVAKQVCDGDNVIEQKASAYTVLQEIGG